MLKEVELQRLEIEAQKLLDRLKDIDREKLVEEIMCFKDILALQKQLLCKNEKWADS